MPTTEDFRTHPSFALAGVASSGRAIGTKAYWRLYLVENIFRVIIHSILTAQYAHGDWWKEAVDPGRQTKAEVRKARYKALSWKSTEGEHGIYYLDISDLVEIMRVASDYLSPLMDVDEWIIRLEEMRLPRNVVAHMNFPTQDDQDYYNKLYKDACSLMKNLEKNSPVDFHAPA